MTTEPTSILNQEATLDSLSKILLRAQETTEHDSLIEALKQDRLNCEGEAYSTGQIHARQLPRSITGCRGKTWKQQHHSNK